MSDKPLFICYSLHLMNFLHENGIRYEVEGRHKVTGKDFWVYVRNEQLNKLLDTWSLNKATRRS